MRRKNSHPLLMLFGALRLSMTRGINMCQQLGLISDNVVAGPPREDEDEERTMIAPFSHRIPRDFDWSQAKRWRSDVAYRDIHFARLNEIADADTYRVLEHFNAHWAAPEGWYIP